jgi:hypothetical protein
LLSSGEFLQPEKEKTNINERNAIFIFFIG